MQAAYPRFEPGVGPRRPCYGRIRFLSFGRSTEAADDEPPAFPAVTTTITKKSMSCAVGTYVGMVAPEMAKHSESYSLHRCHWYPNRVGAFVHPPGVDFNSFPTIRGPETVGGSTFAGGFAVGGGAGAGATTAVALLVAEAEPPPFAAVTFKRSVRPTSSTPSVYVAVVAPAIEAQLAPPLSQRRHWYA